MGRIYKTEMIIQCDCCGKSKTYNEQDPIVYKESSNNDDRYMWTNIRIDARTDNNHYFEHALTICPECCNSVLAIIKEKCNYFENWPTPYSLDDLMVGNQEVK